MQLKLRVLLLPFFVMVFSVFSNFAQAQATDTATIKTDKLDYPPGSTVLINGTGFAPNEDVTLQVIHVGETGDNASSGAHAPWTVSADANGNVSAQWTVPLDEDELGATLKLTADGQISKLHAEWEFTDGLAAPTNLIVTAFSSAQINLSWTGGVASPGYETYSIEQSTTNLPGSFIEIAKTTATSYSVLSLTCNTTYYYQVRALKLNGNGSINSASPYTEVKSAKTVTCPKTDQTITFNTLSTKTYGDADFTLNATASSGLSVTYTVTGNATVTGNKVHITGAGSATITAHQTGNTAYNAAPDVSQAFNINKADAAINVSGYTGTYDATAHGATGTATGVGGVDLSSSLSLGSSFTDAPGGTANWSFNGGTNYNNQSGSVSIAIGQAPSTTVVAITGGPFTYTGAAQTPATVSVTGAGGLSLTLTATYTNNTNAGIAIASYTYGGDANHKGSSDSKTFSIGKATPVITLTVGVAPTYDAAAHYVSGATVAGVNGVSLGNATVVYKQGTSVIGAPINAGDYAVTADYAETANYFAAAQKSGTLTITPRPITITVATGLGKIYGELDPALAAMVTAGSVQLGDVASGALSRVGGENVGPYAIVKNTYTYGSNYNETFVGGSFTITSRPVNVTANTGQEKVYGTANPAYTYISSPAVGTILPNGVAIDFSGTLSRASGENVGSYAIQQGSIANANYNIIYTSNNFTIKPAQFKVEVENKSKVYGETIPALTGTITGVVGADGITASYITSATQYSDVVAGGYPITAVLNDPNAKLNNYTVINIPGVLTISKANASVVITPYIGVYDGYAHTATGVATGVDGINLSSSLSLGTSSTDAPGGTANWLFDGGINYNSQSGTVTNVIEKATPTLNITVGGPFTYDGMAKFVQQAAVLGVNNTPLGNATVDYKQSGTSVSPINAGVYDVYASFAGDKNYNGVSNNSSTLSISKANALINVTGYHVTFDGTPHTATGTATGVENTPADLTILLTLTQTTHSDAGTYTADAWTFAGNNNYNSENGTVNNSIGKATPIVTVVVGGPFTYDGTPKSISSAIVTGINNTVLGNATVEYKQAGNVVNPMNAGSYNVYASFAGNSNYESVLNNSQFLNIGKATPTINVTVGGLLTYNGSAQGVQSATVTGVGNILLGNATLIYKQNSAITTPVNAGTYTVCASFAGDDNYNAAADNTRTLVIGKKTMTVTADNNMKEYGNANPGFTASYSGFAGTETIASSGVTGSPALTTTATAASNAGNYPITAATGTLSSGNYSFNFEEGILTVTKAVLTVTADNKSRAYGAVNPSFTASYSGFKNSQVLESSDVTGSPLLTTTATAISNVGLYGIRAAVGTLSSNNYSFSFADGNLSVTRAPLSVTAANNSRIYGAANPTFTGTLTGVLNGDAITENYSTLATVTTGAGTYPIVADVAATTEVLANYELTKTNGTLTIDKATITVTADPQTKVYGDANPATLTANISGFANGETLATSGVSGAANVTTTATANSPVGNYVLTATLGTLASSNYNFTFVNGTLSITKAMLTVMADDKSKVYGDANPALTATITGFKNGQTLATSGITGAASVTTAVTATTSVGTYNITAEAGTLASSNYSFTYVNGTLTVGKAVLTITAENKSREYGDANPAFTASFSGFKNGQALANSGVTGAPGLATTATETSNVGTYDITAALGTLSADNYQFSFVKGALAITKAVLTITADNSSRDYGSANPAFTATYSGLKNNQTLAISGVNGTPALTTTATAASAIGTYPITAAVGTLASNNYSFGFVNGVLTLNKKAITVTANNVSKTYGATQTLGTTAFSVPTGALVNGNAITGVTLTSTGAAASASAGTYDIIPGSATGSGLTNYEITYANGVLTVNKATLTITAKDDTKPYGCPYSSGNGVTYSGFVNNENETVLGGTLTYTGTSQGAITPGTYTIIPGGLTSNNYGLNYMGGTLTITTKKAVPAGQAFYTGSSFYWTTGANSSTATLTLTATLKNAVKDCGDIRTAKASFFVRSATGQLIPINGAQNLPVGLVNPGDLSTGTASATVQYSISSTVATLNIAVAITGNYQSVNDPISDAEVTIATPMPGGLIVGGGKLCNDSSAGYVKGDANSTTDFSFYVQYNKSLTNQQGGAEITVRSLNDRNGNPTNTLHIYKLRSNAISGLNVKSPGAEFSSKAAVSEIVNGVEQNIEGNCTMQLSIYDANAAGATSGSVDKLAVTVYKAKGGIWFSNNWDGAKTNIKALCDGAVSVTGNGGNTTAATSTVTANALNASTVYQETNAAFGLKASPNPTASQFTLKLESDNTNDVMSLRIVDQIGNVMEVHNNLTAGQTLQIGALYKPGMYFAELLQGNHRKVVKLLKVIN